MVAESVAQSLPSDELAALALACVHLGGKACDTPARLTHVLEFARSRPQNSMSVRRWPQAAPWRDAVLSAEQRILRLVSYDVRLEHAADVLSTFREGAARRPVPELRGPRQRRGAAAVRR